MLHQPPPSSHPRLSPDAAKSVPTTPVCPSLPPSSLPLSPLAPLCPSLPPSLHPLHTPCPSLHPVSLSAGDRQELKWIQVRAGGCPRSSWGARTLRGPPHRQVATWRRDRVPSERRKHNTGGCCPPCWTPGSPYPIPVSSSLGVRARHCCPSRLGPISCPGLQPPGVSAALPSRTPGSHSSRGQEVSFSECFLSHSRR